MSIRCYRKGNFSSAIFTLQNHFCSFPIGQKCGLKKNEFEKLER